MNSNTVAPFLVLAFAAGLYADSGFHMDLPAGWQAQLTADHAIVARSREGNSLVIVAPVLGMGSASPADWLRSRAAAELGRYLNNAAVSAISPSRAGRSSALATVEYASGAGAGVAHVLLFVDGGVGTLYAIAAPRQDFALENGMLLRILRSFSFAGERSGSLSQTGYTRFSDPRENAFSADVPAGWKVQGGTVRRSTLDYRVFVYASSPDGSTVIRLGDPDFGTFTEPSPLLEMAGMHEGMNYSPGYGNVWPIRRYLPGPQFAETYAQKLARENQAGNVQLKSVKPLPQFSANSIPGVTVAAGEADFTCTRNGQPAAGAVYAATERLGMPDGTQGAIWFHVALGDFLSPASQAPAINDMLLHMLESFRMNPQWLARQSNTAMQTARIAHEASEYMAKVHDQAYWSHERAVDHAHQGFDDYIRGVVRLRDPATGQEVEGRAGRNHYYALRGDTAHPIGTDREIQDPDFRELEQMR